MSKISFYLRRIREKYTGRRTKKMLDLSDVTLLSQNCIGGVTYHDCNARFLSPTVNLYMLPSDFLEFVNNYEYYLEEAPVVKMGDKYPVGLLKDKLVVEFMHYETEEDALSKWETRKARINKDKIFVICIERDGFSDEHYKEFKKLKYPKAFFTIRKELKEDPECIYIPRFKNESQIPDIIPYRYMYYKNKLPKLIREAFDK